MNDILNKLFPHPDKNPTKPVDIFQKKTLTLLLRSIGIFCIAFLFISLIIDLTLTLTYPGREVLYQGAVLCLLGVIIILFLQKYVSYLAASLLFNGLIWGIILFTDTPEDFLKGSYMELLILPLITASLLLRPWAGYIVAAVIDIGLIIGYIIFPLELPSIPAMLLLFLVAFILQQFISNLERSLEQEHKNNRILAESEDKYRKIIETSPNAMLVVDPQMIIQDCNQAFLKMYGAVHKEELLNLDSAQLMNLDETHRKREITTQLLQSGSITGFELTFTRKDGSTLTTEFSAAVIADQDGKPASIVCIFQDITEHRRIEIKLGKSEEKFSRAFYYHPTAMAINDTDGRYIEINRAFTRLLGYQQNDVAGRTPTEVGIFVDPEQNKRAVAIFREKGRLQNFEMAVRTQSGEALNGLFFAELLQLGNHPLIITIMNDITEQKKTEARLRASEELYRTLINNLPIGVSTHHAGKVELINPAGAKILGVDDPEELIGRSFIEYIHPEHRDTVRKRIQESLAKGQKAKEIEEKLVRIDGKVVHAAVAAIPFSSGDKTPLLVVFRDITERKRAQEKIALQNQRIREVSRQLMEVREREKHILASELHDDLGQLLTSLKLILELAAGSRSSAERNKKILEARETLSELMQKVRSISLDLRPPMLDDFGLFAALRWLFERLYAQTGISVQCNHDLNSKQRFRPEVETAAFRIIQEALTNVGRHASTQEAQVDIDVGEFLFIEISDSGAGFDYTQWMQMPAETGGLSGMQERTRLLGGQVKIQSKIGAGTRVLAKIPLAGGSK